MPIDINVLWLTYHPTSPAYLYHDQALLHSIFMRKTWNPANAYRYIYRMGLSEMPEDAEGVVVMFPSGFNVGADKAEQLTNDLARFKWVLLILTSDESNYFDPTQVKHPNMEVWVSNPKSNGPRGIYPIGEGFREECPDILKYYRHEALNRQNDYFFSGQDVHPRRSQLNEVLNGTTLSGIRNFTAGFSTGLEYPDYLRAMANAKIAPAPAGSVTQDSFRFYEALEAGCVPIADDRARDPELNPDGYWANLFGMKNLPFPVITDWHDFEKVAKPILKQYPVVNNRVHAWWQNYKRDYAYKLDDTVARLRGDKDRAGKLLQDKITVLVPTSPIPSHPSTEIIEETLLSIRRNIHEAEIILLIDGVRPEQENRRKDYNNYVQKLLWMADHYYNNVVPILFEDHMHQATMTRLALDNVKTPTVLFVEHDTPLDGSIPWEGLVEAVQSEEANMIRLHYDRGVHEDHMYLMNGDTVTKGGIPLRYTRQWSQRPHLASTAWYRQVIKDHIRPEAKTMIEDAMHGPVSENEWERYKLAIYNPPFNMQRSYHLNGRGDDIKYDMQY